MPRAEGLACAACERACQRCLVKSPGTHQEAGLAPLMMLLLMMLMAAVVGGAGPCFPDMVSVDAHRQAMNESHVALVLVTLPVSRRSDVWRRWTSAWAAAHAEAPPVLEVNVERDRKVLPHCSGLRVGLTLVGSGCRPRRACWL